MAERRWASQFTYGFIKQPVVLDAIVSITDGSGTPVLQVYNPIANTYATAPSTGFHGVKSVTRSAAGKYVFALQDPYARLVSVSAEIENATGISASPNLGVLSGSSDTNVQSTTAPKITVQFSTGGVATDPASGDRIRFTIELENSTAAG